jgi:hypothetical protein
VFVDRAAPRIFIITALPLPTCPGNFHQFNGHWLDDSGHRIMRQLPFADGDKCADRDFPTPHQMQIRSVQSRTSLLATLAAPFTTSLIGCHHNFWKQSTLKYIHME